VVRAFKEAVEAYHHEQKYLSHSFIVLPTVCYLPKSLASNARSLPEKPAGVAEKDASVLLPIMPLSASSLMVTPAAIMTATDAEATNNGLDARVNMLCDFTVEFMVGATGVPEALLLVVALVVCGFVGVVALDFAVLADVGVVEAAGVAALLFLALLPEVVGDDPPPDELVVGAAVGVTPGT
jgi:hypothetical protein